MLQYGRIWKAGAAGGPPETAGVERCGFETMKLRYVPVLLFILALMTVVPILGCGGEGGAKEGDTVRVHYTGTLDDGTVFDSSVDGEPLEFTVGEGEVIDGFDQAVLGMKPGESKTVHIPVDEAYGSYNDELVFDMERSKFPDDVEVDDRFTLTRTDGQQISIKVIAVTESTVTVDANHQLAGEDLNFEIELVEIL